MTPDAFRSELTRLGLTQAGAARFLKMDPRQLRRWAKGETPIPHAVELLLGKLKPKDVKSGMDPQ